MSNLPLVQKLTGAFGEGERSKHDFYPTPMFATEALLDRERFDGKIWEPACGDGAISEVLKEYGYDVLSTDLYDQGYDHVDELDMDFLHTVQAYDNIITNPPFNIGTKFVMHALNLAQRKVAMFLKLTFLEGVERKKTIFGRKNLKTVYVFSKRVGFGNENKGGMMAFAWFVWDKEYSGNPAIKWI